MCLDYDGNLRDACVIALLAALKISMCCESNICSLLFKFTIVVPFSCFVLLNCCARSWFSTTLLVAQLPEATISTETRLPVVDMEKKHGLNIRKHPVGSSFCIFDEWVNQVQLFLLPGSILFAILVFSLCRSTLIVDPTDEEENLSTAQVTVVTDEGDRLCAVHKPGQRPDARSFNCLYDVLFFHHLLNSIQT